MKALIGFLLLVSIGLSLYTLREIRTLRTEMAALKGKVEEQQRSSDLLGQAARALQQASESVKKVDTAGTKGALDTAREKVSEAAKVVGEKAQPAVKWLEGQVSGLGKQLQGSGAK